ncbi:MAG: DUF447 domain-containing protein [Planctomycetota bacterium]
MILESIVTTTNKIGDVNVAPMGPWMSRPEALDRPDGDPGFQLRPFKGSQSCANLLAVRRAVIHVTDDVMLFAQSALASLDNGADLVDPLDVPDLSVLKDCHRWFAVEVTNVREDGPRYLLECRVIRSGLKRPFFGFNRAKHAVIEAAILATRIHLIDEAEVVQQLDWLSPWVKKTGGERERAAFELVVRTISQRLGRAVARPVGGRVD